MTRPILLVAVCLGFIAVSTYFSYPVYSDELGYISNAAFLAGHTVEGATSYHCGYSLLLVPFYYLVNDCFALWKCILVANGILWAGTFYLYFLIIDALFPDFPESTRTRSVVLLMVYPACIIMSGYGFSSTLLFFLTALSILCLLRVSRDSWTSTIPLGVCCGFTYWVHPLGLAVIAASLLSLVAICHERKKYRVLFAQLVVTAAFVFSYNLFIKPHLITGMTHSGIPSQLHYPGFLTMLSHLFVPRTAIETLLRIAGQASYFFIVTGGIIVQGLCRSLRNIQSDFTGTDRSKESAEEAITPLKTPTGTGTAHIDIYLLTAFVMSAIMGGISLTANHEVLIDSFIYGRYCDPFIFPLMLFSLLSRKCSFSSFVYALAFVLFTAGGIDLFRSHYQLDPGFNLVNVPALWTFVFAPFPRALALFFPGILLAAILHYSGQRLRYALLAGAFLVAIGVQLVWHNNICAQGRKVNLVKSLVSRLPHSATIYADADSFVRIDANRPTALLHWLNMATWSFYLYNHPWERCTLKDWAENGMRNVFITCSPLDTQLLSNGRLFIHQPSSGLSILGSKDLPALTIDERRSLPTGFFTTPDCTISSVASQTYTYTGAELFSKGSCGKIQENGAIASNGTAGRLFTIPPIHFREGPGLVTLHLNAESIDGSAIGFMGGRTGYIPGKTLPLASLGPIEDGMLKIPFTVKNNDFAISIALTVSAGDSISLSRCEVGPSHSR